MTKYYAKILADTPLMLPKGKFKFPKHENGNGYIKTENDALIFELDKLISRNIGGVQAITEEEYNEAIKKNASLKAAQVKPAFKDQALRIVAGPPVSPRSARPNLKPVEKAVVSAASAGVDELPLPSPFKDAKMVGYKPDIDKLLKKTKRK